MDDLPPMAQLRAFEAVCRLGSATAAARALGMTQGAVSRLVMALEAGLGVPLFRREGRHLVPLPAAAHWAAELGPALEAIARGAAGLRQGAGRLVLAVLPGFAAGWLVPRLARFRDGHQGVALHLATRLNPFDLGAEGFDAAIHFGAADWPGAVHLKLWDEVVVPCAAPGGGARALLALQSRPGAWERWYERRGQAAPGVATMFDQFAPMIAAAAHGMGVALLPDFLAAPELAAGRLVALAPPEPEGGAYWLVWPQRGGPAALTVFRDWIAEEAQTSRSKTVIPS